MKCPICEKEINGFNRYYWDDNILKQRVICSDSNHFYKCEYGRGFSIETIGAVEISSHYSDSEEKRNLILKQYKLVSKLEKEHYRKKLNDAKR